MTAIWSAQNKYEIWLQIELLACEGRVREGALPQAVLDTLKAGARINADRIGQLEREVKHDVIAFLSSITEQVGEAGRFLHWGMTSSDVLDTALAAMMQKAADILIDDLTNLLNVLKEKAFQYQTTVMIGRSHGMHGEPITFGLKMALWYDEMQRNLRRMREARDVISVGKLSGAMGTFAHLSPTVERFVCDRMGLQPEPVSNQVVQRDRHAQYMQTLALIAASLEKFATEIRHLQRTEVGEAEEPFSTGQKGSSSMPHKRNPISSENICGLARVVRAHAATALENVPLWHERDISHSSVERIMLPDSTILLDFMLDRFTRMMRGLVVYPDRMLQNLMQTGGVIFSQNLLLRLIDTGMQREQAYEAVQSAAMQSLRDGGTFQKMILESAAIRSHLNPAEIEACFDPQPFIRHTETIYQRVFEASGGTV
jgi:adenylosuccinate lyase